MHSNGVPQPIGDPVGVNVTQPLQSEGTSNASTLGKKMQDKIDPRGSPIRSQRKFSNRGYELPSIAFMFVEHSSVTYGALLCNVWNIAL